MTYCEEVDRHRGYSFLLGMRMWLREEFITRVPEFMVGAHILFWQVDDLVYRAEMKIEHKIWSRRFSEYRARLKELNAQCYRECRDKGTGEYVEDYR